MAMKTKFPTINSCQFIHKTWGGVWVVIAVSSINPFKLKCCMGFVMSQSIPTGYIPPGQPPGINSNSLPGGSRFDFRKLPGGREFDKDRDFVENESETSKK